MVAVLLVGVALIDIGRVYSVILKMITVVLPASVTSYRSVCLLSE